MKEYGPEIYTRDGLTNLGIYELRELARSFGVVSPTSKNKQDIVEEILEIIYGVEYESLENLIKGRPNKSRRETDWVGVVKTSDDDLDDAYGKLDRNFSGFNSFVASPTCDYVNDAKINTDGIDEGILVNENFGFYIKSFASTGHYAIDIFEDERFAKAGIEVGDILKYRVKDGQVVEIIGVHKMKEK